MYLVVMVAGLVGLVVMALPAFWGSGHGVGGKALAARGAGKLTGHVAAGKAVVGHAPAPTGLVKHGGAVHHVGVKQSGAAAHASVTRFLPSPRTVFSLMALFGAFANALEHAGLPALPTVVAAAIGAAVVERLVVLRVWNLLFHVQAGPCSPLEALVLSEAKATTPFRNGKGLVAIVRDGRIVQFAARLGAGHENEPVEVGDALVVDDVDAAKERVTVSLRRE